MHFFYLTKTKDNMEIQANVSIKNYYEIFDLLIQCYPRKVVLHQVKCLRYYEEKT